MVRINLAPREKKRKGARTSLPSMPSIGRPSGDFLSASPQVLLGVAALVALVAAVFLYFGEKRSLAEAEAAIVEAEQDSVDLHDQLQRVRRLEEVQARLATRVAMMEQVVEGRTQAIELWEMLSDALPATTWLEEIDREDLAADQIRITGATFQNAAITDYMRALEASDELERVTLIGVSRIIESQGDREVSYQSFTLVASYENFTAVSIAPDTTEGSE